MIPVNKPYLPAFEKYSRYISGAFDRAWLTNNGPLAQELKLRLEDYLGVKNLLIVSNGTLSLQIAYKVFGLSGNAVTTPFTFVATSSSLQWENIDPLFTDIDPETYNLTPEAAARAINAQTTAIVPVHVYGNPADLEGFQRLATKTGLKVIYDAAHAFGVKVNGQSVLNFGDASSLSFHATKVFHTVEGGAIIFKNSDDYEQAVLMTNFGIDTGSGAISSKGINTKVSEVHAAMGLAVLDNIDQILKRRVELFELYVDSVKDVCSLPKWAEGASYNGAYMPVTFGTAEQCIKVLEGLREGGVVARRYFSPSLNTLDIYNKGNSFACPVSESLAPRTLCLPLYYDLTPQEVATVVTALKRSL